MNNRHIIQYYQNYENYENTEQKSIRDIDKECCSYVV